MAEKKDQDGKQQTASGFRRKDDLIIYRINDPLLYDGKPGMGMDRADIEE